jgi:hypothetical protein
VVGALGERLILSAHGASSQRLIEALDLGLDAGDEKHFLGFPVTVFVALSVWPITV